MTTLNSRLQLSILNRKKGRNLLEKGFTLVELMIVIVVVGVLSAVALPEFLGVKDKAVAASEVGEYVGLAKECSTAIIIEGPYPADYPAEDNAAISADCNGGDTATPPAVNVVFTGKVITDALDGTVSCGPVVKPAVNEACQITVNSDSGAIVFGAV
jgi:type IV pilus assembly protein PilA